MAVQVLYMGAGVVALLFLKYLVTLLFSRQKLPLPPGPSPLPVIGNVHQYPKETPWIHYHEWSKTYGPIMHLNMAGQSVVILNKLEVAQALLSKRGADYSDRPRSIVVGELATKGLHMLLRPNDDNYRLHQRMESPVLNFRAANAYRPIQELESRQCLLDLLTSSDDSGGQGVDFNRWIERTNASSIYALLYGYRLETGLEQELQDAKIVQIECVKRFQPGAHVVEILPMLNYLPAPLAPWKREAETLWHLELDLHMGNMERGLKNPGWNFTKHMKQSSEAKHMSPDEFAFDLGILADAALDTTTMTIDWFIIAWLTQNTTFVAKAQKLIDEVVGHDRFPEFDDQPQLTYITAIIYEVLRWRPVVPGGVPHRFSGKKDDEFQNYRIPANSLVIANHWGIARDESVFGRDPDAFVPERWICEQGESIVKLKDGLKDLYHPGFGFGRRVCTGQHIARRMLFIMISRLLWAFDIEPAIDDDGKEIVIDPMAATVGFATRPLQTMAMFRPRSDKIRDLIEREGKTHSVDLVPMLNQAAAQRSVKV